MLNFRLKGYVSRQLSRSRSSIKAMSSSSRSYECNKIHASGLPLTERKSCFSVNLIRILRHPFVCKPT